MHESRVSLALKYISIDQRPKETEQDVFVNESSSDESHVCVLDPHSVVKALKTCHEYFSNTFRGEYAQQLQAMIRTVEKDLSYE